MSTTAEIVPTTYGGDEWTPVVGFKNGRVLCLERGQRVAWSVERMLVPR